MKLPLLVAAVAVSLAQPATAATVILGGAGETNFSVTVPTNTLMVVRACSLDNMGPRASLTVGGATCQPVFNTGYQARYLSGPCTFLFASGNLFSGAVFSYDLVPAGGVQTRVSPNSAVTIQIPNGKRLRLLDGSYPLDFSITNASNVSANFKVANNPESAMGQAVSARELELSGPLTVEVNSNEAMNWGLYVTYYFVEDVAQAAGPSVQAPAGSLVTVEKSTDLQAWQPAFITPETSAPKAFYRLKVVK